MNLYQGMSTAARAAMNAGATVARSAAQFGRNTTAFAKAVWVNKIRPGFRIALSAIASAMRWVGNKLAQAYGWLWKVAGKFATAVKRMAVEVGNAYRSGYSRLRNDWKGVKSTARDFVRKPIRTTVKVTAKAAGKAVRTVNAVNRKIAGAFIQPPNPSSMKPSQYRKAVRKVNRRINTSAATMTMTELLAGYGVVFGTRGGGSK